MSVEFGKPSDDQHTAPTRLYVSVAQLPDGRVHNVDVYAIAPDPDFNWIDGEARTTVWTAVVPDIDDDDASTAAKVLDLTNSGQYRNDNPTEWADGERIAKDFDADHAGERTFLRTVEAHLIRAGYLDAHTGMVQCQTFGLRFEDHFVVKWGEGWKWITEDSTDFTGMFEQPGVIAPADASPRRLANAIVDNLASLGMIPRKRLSLRDRARARLRQRFTR